MIAQIVSDQVAAGVDGVISPGTPQNAAIYRDLEIPYSTFDLMDPELPTLHVGPRQYATGKYLGDEMVKALGGADEAEGVVLVGICVAGLELLEQRAQGIIDGLSAAAGLEVVGPFATHTDLTQNYAVYEQQYSAHPDAVALVGTCSTDTVSIGQLNTANGMKYIGFGFDVTPETLQVVSDGSVKLTMGQGAYLQGYVPVLAVVQAARKGEMLEPGFFDSTGGVFEPVTIGNWSMHMDFFDHPEKMYEYYLKLVPEDLASAIQPIDEAFK
jgi:simple sugar transport system substrate-binding protein